MKRITLLLILVLGAVLLKGVEDLPDWGDPLSPAARHVSDYYITHTMSDTAVPNIVTSVLADYRGYDTMFETVVIFCAGITVLTLLRRTHRQRKKVLPPRSDRAGADIVLQAASRLLIPMMQIFALYVVAHGHHSPGGGFQGGVIMGASFILLALSHDVKTLLALLHERTVLLLSGVGVLIYAGIGFFCMFLGGNFLDYSALAGVLGVSPVMARSHGMLGVEIGVAFTVTAIMVSLYLDLATGGELDEGL